MDSTADSSRRDSGRRWPLTCLGRPQCPARRRDAGSGCNRL